MNKARIAILSSVKPGTFSNFINDKKFTEQEIQTALMDEIDVWKSILTLNYIIKNTSFEVINVLEGLPRKGEYDGYILGGSQSMITERTSWIINLERFIHNEINSGKHVIGFCFGHQILASAFGGTVEDAHCRNIGNDTVFLNAKGQADKLFSQMNSNFESIWSHKQYVSYTGESESLGYNHHTPNQIIRIGDNAWGCQFHPEFSKEFCSFLVKLMSDSIGNEGLSVQKILANLEAMRSNEGSKVVTLFIQNLLET